MQSNRIARWRVSDDDYLSKSVALFLGASYCTDELSSYLQVNANISYVLETGLGKILCHKECKAFRLIPTTFVMTT